MSKLLEVIRTQIGVQEDPAHTNRGERVSEYQIAARLGTQGGFPWCQSLIVWCGDQAYGRLKNPVPRTGGVLECFRMAKESMKKGANYKIYLIPPPELLVEEYALMNIKPGMQAIFDHGKGTGHTGIVSAITEKGFMLISGNTNSDGSRDGYEVNEKEYFLNNPKLIAFICYPE